MKQFLKTLAVFSGINHVRTGANDGDTSSLKTQRQLQRGLTTVLNNHAKGFFFVDNFKNVFQGQGFKVKTITGVVISRNRFRVAIDHDGFVAIFSHGQCGMNTAIVKFNPLTNAVRPSA